MIKISYSSIDAAYIEFSSAAAVDSVQVAEGIVYDLDKNDEVVGIEILGVKTKTHDQIKQIYQYTEYPLKEKDIQSLKELFRQLSPALA